MMNGVIEGPDNPAGPFAVVVNDNPTQLTILSGLVSKAGLEPRAFISAEAALIDMAAYSGVVGSDSWALPSLVVTDLYMPGIDGWRFCRLLRSPEYASFNQVPILVVSATYTGEEPQRIAAELGAEAFLSSPVEGRHFVNQVHEILRGGQTRNTLRVLIVEDSKPLSHMLRKTFEANGYQVQIATTVQEAVAAAQTTSCDVAVFDYHLPDGMGDSLLKIFRKQRPDCICLMMTTDPSAELALEWMKQGAAAYLRKPFKANYLIELCNRARRERALLRVQDLLELRTREMQRSEDRFRRLFEHNAAVKLMIDPDTGKICEANKAAADFYGWSIEELRQMCIHEINILPPADVKNKMEITRVSGTMRHEFRHRRADKSIRDVEVFCCRIEISGRDVLYSSIHDITDSKLVQEQKVKFESLNRQLKKNDSLQRMAGAIAHHFNNQLGVVIGSLEMALDDLPSGTRLDSNLNAAMQGAHKAAQVSSLMLTYLGQTIGARVPLDLSEVCRQGLPLLKAAAPEGLRFDVDLPCPGPIVNANANQIQQILTSLVTNAWEAIGDKPGAVTLEVRTVSSADIPEEHRFPPGWHPQNLPYADMEIADTGHGIAKDDIDKLFDPFYSTKFTGRGLGLSVVFGLVKACDGAVTVASAVEHGSIFRVFLPVAVEEFPEIAVNIPANLSVGFGTVLLVEDEEMLREMVATIIIRMGYKVLTAKDGIDAQEVFRNHINEINVVVSDLIMPRMDGWETLTALRQIRPDIPVIFTSGHDESTVLVGDPPEHPQFFLRKPYKMSDLQVALAKAVGASMKTK